jgi:hypothetical protein
MLLIGEGPFGIHDQQHDMIEASWPPYYTVYKEEAHRYQIIVAFGLTIRPATDLSDLPYLAKVSRGCTVLHLPRNISFVRSHVRTEHACMSYERNLASRIRPS